MSCVFACWVSTSQIVHVVSMEDVPMMFGFVWFRVFAFLSVKTGLEPII